LNATLHTQSGPTRTNGTLILQCRRRPAAKIGSAPAS
jgi:hypothetical protein